MPNFISDQRTTPRKFPRRGVRTMAALGAIGLTTTLASCSSEASDGSDFPSKDFEYIIPYNPGGSTDPIGREFSTELSALLGNSATALNVPGGDESIALTQLTGAKPDGHTLGMASSAGLLAQPMLNDDVQYDGLEDFTPVVKMSDTPYALLVAKDSPYKTLDDLVKAAKKDPGKVRIGTANRMGNSAFVVYELEDQAGIKTTVVPGTGGSGETALQVMGGRIEAMVATASGQLGLVESGDLRALAYTGEEDYSKFLPKAQSFKDAGYDIPFIADYMTLAPANLPPAVQDKLASSAQEVTKSKKWKEWSATQGALTDNLTGQELKDYLKKAQKNIAEAIELGKARGE